MVSVVLMTRCRLWILLVRCWPIPFGKCSRFSLCCWCFGFYHDPNCLLLLMMAFYPRVVFFFLVVETFSHSVRSVWSFCNELFVLGIHVVWSSLVFRIVHKGYLCIFLVDTSAFFVFVVTRLFWPILRSYLYVFYISSVLWIVGII